jgi:hypothetical protein
MNYVLLVHGIGEQQPGSYDDFGERIRKAFYGPIYWGEAFWADVTQPDEQLLKARVGRGGLLHSFYIGSFGDLVAYSKLPYPPDKYTEIQRRFAGGVQRMAYLANEHNDTNACLSVIGHSLGSVIASDGLYDLIKSRHFPSNMKLQCFFTMGSPLALYALRYGLENFTKPVRPITWLNFYYSQDVAALALKPLNSDYDKAVTEDICLSPDGLKHRLLAMVPGLGIKSHSWYFTDRQVIETIARELRAWG